MMRLSHSPRLKGKSGITLQNKRGLRKEPSVCLIKVSLCKRVQQRLDGTLSLGLSHRLIGILTPHDRA